MIIFNFLGLGMAAAAFAMALLVELVTKAGGMATALPTCLTMACIDLHYRSDGFKLREQMELDPMRLVHPRAGGMFFYIPVWVCAGLVLFAALLDTNGRSASLGQVVLGVLLGILGNAAWIGALAWSRRPAAAARAELAAPADPDSLQGMMVRLATVPTEELYRKALTTLGSSSEYDPYSDELAQAEALGEAGDFTRAAQVLATLNLGFSPRAHMMLSFLGKKLGQPKSEAVHAALAMGCQKGILATGDGSRERPYLVARVEDEYDTLAHLGKSRTSQALVECGAGRYLDALACDDGSVVHFDVTLAQRFLRTSALKAEALEALGAYWTACPEERLELTAREDRLEGKDLLRLHHLVCLEMLAGEPLNAPAGELREQCQRLAARLLAPESPYRQHPMDVVSSAGPGRPLTRNASLTHLGCVEVLRLRDGRPAGLAFVPLCQIRSLRLGAFSLLIPATLETWNETEEVLLPGLYGTSLASQNPLDRSGQSTRFCCHIDLPGVKMTCGVGFGQQDLLLAEPSGSRVVGLSQIQQLNASRAAPEATAALDQWTTAVVSAPPTAGPEYAGLETAGLVAEVPPPVPPREPLREPVSSPALVPPARLADWQDVQGYLLMVEELSVVDFGPISQALAALTGELPYELARQMRTLPQGVVAEQLSEAAAASLTASLEAGGYQVTRLPMTSRPRPRVVAAQNLSCQPDALLVNGSERLPWDSLRLLLGGLISTTSQTVQAGPVRSPGGGIIGKMMAGGPDLQTKTSTDQNLVADLYAQLPEGWLRVRLEARKLSYAHLGERMQSGFRLNFPLLLEDLLEHAPALKSSAGLDSLVRGHHRSFSGAELESHGLGLILQSLASQPQPESAPPAVGLLGRTEVQKRCLALRQVAQKIRNWSEFSPTMAEPMARIVADLKVPAPMTELVLSLMGVIDADRARAILAASPSGGLAYLDLYRQALEPEEPSWLKDPTAMGGASFAR